MIPDLPGWDSLTAVTRYHNWAEMAGIIAVAVLVVAEVVQFKYGHRRDDLAAQEQTATNQRHDEEMARLHLETANANAKALEAQAELEKYRAPRRLSTERKNEITQRIKEFREIKFAMSAVGPEPIDLAIDLADALQAGGWKWVEWPMAGIITNLPGRTTVGSVALTGTEIQVYDPSLANAGNALLQAIHGDPIFERVRGVQGAAPYPLAEHLVIVMIGTKP
jgi:hypothetical protein